LQVAENVIESVTKDRESHENGHREFREHAENIGTFIGGIRGGRRRAVVAYAPGV
jgi:hypothetical protein